MDIDKVHAHANKPIENTLTIGGAKQGSWKRNPPHQGITDMVEITADPLGTKRKGKVACEELTSVKEKRQKLEYDIVVLGKVLAMNFGLVITATQNHRDQ